MSGAPYPYNGVVADADFSTPAQIIVDGIPWQFGAPDTGAGGHFDVSKKLLDRVAWLKAHGGFIDVENTWTAEQHFTGGVELQSAIHLGSARTLTADGIINVTSSGSLICGSGATVQFVGNVEIDGTLRMVGAGAKIRERIGPILDNSNATIDMGAIDLVFNTVPLRTSTRTWQFNAPASGVSCVTKFMFFVDPSSNRCPNSFGALLSNQDVVISAGAGAHLSTVILSHTAGAVISGFVVYDGSDFWISALAEV